MIRKKYNPKPTSKNKHVRKNRQKERLSPCCPARCFNAPPKTLKRSLTIFPDVTGQPGYSVRELVILQFQHLDLQQHVNPRLLYSTHLRKTEERLCYEPASYFLWEHVELMVSGTE